MSELIELARSIVKQEGRLDVAAFLQEHPEAPADLVESLPGMVRLWRLLLPVASATTERVLLAIRQELRG